MPEHLLNINHLSKSFHKRKVLEDISFHVAAGEVVGLLGLNGCGKSTLLHLVSGILLPDSGSVVFGEKHPQSTHLLGVAIGPSGFYLHHSAYTNLAIAAQIKGLPKSAILPALQRMGLDVEQNTPVRKFSSGMLQRLAIASAFMGKPSLVILDEPTNNLDERYVEIWKMWVREIAESGGAVLLTNHQLHEVKITCNRVVLLHEHRIIGNGSIEEILNTAQRLEEILVGA